MTISPSPKIYKNQLSLTNPRYITANVLQTNKVDVQCDKIATELVDNASRRKLHRTCN